MKTPPDNKNDGAPSPPPAPSSTPQAASLEQLLALAVRYLGAGNLSQADAACRQLLEAAPEHPVALHLSGVIRLQSGQPQAAVDILEKAVAADPDNAEIHTNLGTAFAGTGQPAKAVASYRKALTLNPNSANALNNLGYSLMALGQSGEAMERYHQALALAPNDINAHNNLGVAYLAQAELDKASDCFKRALDIKPDFAKALRNLGTTLREQGEADKAIATYRKALAISPDDAGLHNDLGYVLMLAGQLDEAITSYQSALARQPDFARARDNLGDALRARGQIDEAIPCFEQARLGSSPGKILECLFELGRYEDFFQRAALVRETDGTNIRAAAISAYAAQQLGREDPLSFCKTPLDFVHVGSFADASGDAQTMINALADDLSRLTPLWEGNTTKQGFQTLNNLFQAPQGALARLEKIIRDEIETYFAAHGSDDCLFVRQRPEQFQLNGWFVRLLDQGHQSVHNHPTGWLSGVCYLKVPAPKNGDEDGGGEGGGKNGGGAGEGGGDEIGDEGAIEFGLHGNNYPVLTDAHPTLRHQPKAGELVLFPSSLFHRTIPITTSEERWSIAFDMVPG